MTYSPKNIDYTNKTVTWTSSDDTKASVSNGKVIAISAGTATITAQAGNQTATCIVTVENNPFYDAGVVINGVKWATRNVDAFGTFAATPESAGMFYQWNRKIAWSATGSVTGWDNSPPTGDTWEKSNDPSPKGWRVPTREEQQKLFDAEKVVNEWTTQNGVTGSRLFLPAAGYRNGSDGALYYAGALGSYWSSAARESYESYAYGLGFNASYADWHSSSRSYGFSIRAVAE